MNDVAPTLPDELTIIMEEALGAWWDSEYNNMTEYGESTWKPKPKYTHKSDTRVVTSVDTSSPKNATSLPKEMLVVMEKALELKVPVQIQFEIVPSTRVFGETENYTFDGPGIYAYLCSINSVKCRIKPCTAQFVGDEEKGLAHIIDGTEDMEEKKRRAEKQAQKHAGLAKKKEDEANRFTGLEL